MTNSTNTTIPSAVDFYEKENLSALDALHAAQKIAFAPFVFQATRSLRDLGILTCINEAGSAGLSQEEVVAKTKVSEYGVRVLLEASLGIGLCLYKEGKYVLTKTGYFILNDPMTRANMDFVHDVNYQGFYWLKESIENGKPEGLRVFGEQWDTIYPALSSLPEKAKESWFVFDHYYSDGSFNEALPIVFANNPKKLTDVGGNTGKWARTCLAYNNEVNVTIADLPQQIKLAQGEFESNAHKDRIHYHPLNILDESSELPKGQDVIWMSQFLDCFSDDQIVKILKKASKAMDDNSTLYIMETFWDHQKYPAAAFSLQQISLYFTCLANGNSQMYHSDNMIKCIEKSGLKVAEVYPNIGVSHTILKCVK